MEWTAKALARATGTDTDLDELKIGRDLLWSRMLLSLVAAMAFGPDVWGPFSERLRHSGRRIGVHEDIGRPWPIMVTRLFLGREPL